MAVFFFIACSNDHNPPLPEPLPGDYTGYMYYQAGPISPDSQAIVWKFTPTGYIYSLDTMKSTSQDRHFCDAYGDYTLTDAITFTQAPNWVPNVVCDALKNPSGRFVILVRDGGHLKMSQVNQASEVTVAWTIDLYRI